MKTIKTKDKIITCPECKVKMSERGFKYFHIENAHKENYYDFMIKHGTKYKEGKDYVVCKVCKMKCSRLAGGHLEKKHNLTMEAYLKKYPSSQLHCEKFSKKQKIIKENQYKNYPDLRQKAGKREHRNELWQMLSIQEPKEEDYRPRPLTNLIFANEPSIEQSVILLFGHLCDQYNIIIEQLWSHKFPDCKALIKSKKRRDKYIPIYIEFEPKSSKIRKHRQIKDGSWKKTSPLILVCWEDDDKKLPKGIIVLELKKEIEKLRKKKD
jgi:hypothetical protein